MGTRNRQPKEVTEQRIHRVNRIVQFFLIITLFGWIYDLWLVEEEEFTLEAPRRPSSPSSSSPLIRSQDSRRPKTMSRQCAEAVLPDCGCESLGHATAAAVGVAALVLLAASGTRFERLKRAGRLASVSLGVIAVAAISVIVTRKILGIPAPAASGRKATGSGGGIVAGAFVLNMPSATAKWAAMQNLLHSFPPGTVHRVPGKPATSGSVFMGEKFHMPANKYRITMAHIAALELVSQQPKRIEPSSFFSAMSTARNDTRAQQPLPRSSDAKPPSYSPKEGAKSGASDERKAWYLIFEDDANTQQPLSSLHATVSTIVSALPKDAQALNLGACKGRTPALGLQTLAFEQVGGARKKYECGFFGLDPLTFVSNLAAKPLELPWKMGAPERGELGGESSKGGIRGQAGQPARARHLHRLHRHLRNGTAGGDQQRHGGGSRWSSNGDATGLRIYRGFGSCRHAYAVTPVGARWMIAVLLRNVLKDLPPKMTKKVAGDSTLAAAAVFGSAPSWLTRSHSEYFFTRVFGQSEWEGCAAS